MRSAQTDHCPDLLGPGIADVTRAACHEPAHRVPDQTDRLDRLRPFLDQRFEQVAEFTAVVTDVAAGVVADEDRRETGVLKALPVRRPAAERPGPIVLSQTVHEHDEMAGPIALDSRCHGDGQRRVLAFDEIPVEAVHHRLQGADPTDVRGLAPAARGQLGRSTRCLLMGGLDQRVDDVGGRLVHPVVRLGRRR